MSNQVKFAYTTVELGSALAALATELNRAERIWPCWPMDPVYGAAIIGEEAGEALQAALHLVYERGTEEELRKEVIQTGAMALRMLLYLSTRRDGAKGETE